MPDVPPDPAPPGQVEGAGAAATTPVAALPSFARVHLAHAVVQRVAEDAGVSLLHLKGPALLPGLRRAGRPSSDVDVLVRPGQFEALERELEGHGWTPYSHLDSGSAFGHAANWFHPWWGYADLHASWPGPTVSPEQTFTAFGEDGFDQLIAHVACPVPSRTAQILVLLLHGARSASDDELELAWHQQSQEQRDAVVALADRLGARVALAAALGDLDGHRGDSSHDLWQFYRDGGGRVDEWRARYRAAATPADRRRVLASALRVNRDYLRIQLRRPPTRVDVLRAQLVRVATLVRESGRIAARRLRGGAAQ